jgi:hypothetical protein
LQVFNQPSPPPTSLDSEKPHKPVNKNPLVLNSYSINFHREGKGKKRREMKVLQKNPARN